MTSLLLSDLHLPATESPLRAGFIAFLQGPAMQADAVYLLGDIFEHWIGDDIGLASYAAEVHALAALAARGVAVYWMHGNRDFLAGQDFVLASGIRVLDDPSVVDIEGQRWMLSHGDVFCLDDHGYQRWRRIVRKPWIQALFLRLPRHLRESAAQKMRLRSEQATRLKTAQIMDVHPQAVVDSLRGQNLQGLIHGHTHRPAEHAVDVEGQKLIRLVLADWRCDRQEYLQIDGPHLQRIRLDQPAV